MQMRNTDARARRDADDGWQLPVGGELLFLVSFHHKPRTYALSLDLPSGW